MDHEAEILACRSIFVKRDSVSVIHKVGHGPERFVDFCDLKHNFLLMFRSDELEVYLPLIRDAPVVGGDAVHSLQ